MSKVRSPSADDVLARVVSHCKEYGFVYPSSDIYGGLQGVYDYGPYGVALKDNLRTLWQKTMQLHEHVVRLDAAILMHPRVWEASGHTTQFHDVFVDNRDSKKRYRIDALLADHCRTLDDAQAQVVMHSARRHLQEENFARLNDLLTDHKVRCSVSGTGNWTPVRKINLMFSTGAEDADHDVIHLRPETAQGIFVNFLHVQKSLRMRLPFGVAQTGKAFRDELIVRQFLFRMREFEQMEMQFFVAPDQEAEWFVYWMKKRMQWYRLLGIPAAHLATQQHEQLAHYATKAVDITYAFPFGAREVEGIHARGAFDLSQHERQSGKRLRYYDPDSRKDIMPHVVEVSCGLDRLLLMLLCHALREEKLAERSRTYLAIPPMLAPVKVAVFPLVRKDGLREKAQSLHKELRYHFPACYEETASIGKRYARQDLIGTPYCLTVDYESLQNDSVTVRERDSMQQERVSLAQICDYIHKKTSMTEWLKKL